METRRFEGMKVYDFNCFALTKSESNNNIDSILFCDGQCYSGCNDDCYADACDQGGSKGCNY